MKRSKIMKSASVVVAISLLFGTQSANSAIVTKLTTAQKAQLQYIVEEEKLARDVYLYLSSKVTTQKFANIAKSEQTHMNLISDLLKAYKITNPTTGKAAGVFKDPKLQSLYKSLTKTGSASVLAAYGVGVSIEELDIADIKKMLKTTWPTDAKSALDRLLSGSQNHLSAFKG